MTTEKSLTENDIRPGAECPACGENIVTYFTTMDTDGMHPSNCAIDADKVKPTGPMGEWSGDTIVIDHVGPKME